MRSPIRFEVFIAARADDPAHVRTRVGTFAGETTVGRAETANVRLDHDTVGFDHLRLEPNESAMRVRTLTNNGTTFIDGKPLPVGELRTLDVGMPFVQVGQFLLEIQVLAETKPHLEPIPIPNGLMMPPVLHIKVGHRGGVATLGGYELPLPPKPFLTLLGLASNPDQPVRRDALIDIVAPDQGWTNLDPYVHRLRTAINAACDADPAVRSAIEDAIGPVDGDVGKRLIRTIRGVGYQLELPFGSVEVASQRLL